MKKKNHLSKHIREFKSKTKPQISKSKRLQEDILNSVLALLKIREMAFKSFESLIFLKHKELKQSQQSSDSNIDYLPQKRNRT